MSSSAVLQERRLCTEEELGHTTTTTTTTAATATTSPAPEEMEAMEAGESTEKKADRCCDVEERLSQGLLGMWLPTVDQLQDTLHEIVQSQEELVAKVETESQNVAQSKAFEEVSVVMSQVPTYTQKLAQIRKDMVALHDKSNRMKKRAEKLAMHKTKTEQKAAEVAAQEREREERLQARPVGDVLPTQQAAPKKKMKKRTSTGSNTSASQDPGIIVVNPGPKANTAEKQDDAKQ